MTRGRRTIFWLLALMLGLILFVLLVWFQSRLVVGPLDYANKDFMSLWSGGRALLRGLDPYDAAVWGPLRIEYGSEWLPDARAPFPLWTFVLMVPISLFPLPLAAAIWLTLQELLLVGSVIAMVLVVGRYRPTSGELLLLMLASFISAATVLVLINGQMTYLLLAVLVLYLVLQEKGYPFAAGGALALLALKPNPFILFVPLLGIWLVSRRLWRTVAGAAFGGIFLLVTTWMLLPGWVQEWLNVRGKTEVAQITPTVWGLAADISETWWIPVGLVLTVAITAALGWLFVTRANLKHADVVGLALAGSLLVTPYTWAYEHGLLYLPWLWAFARMANRRRAQAAFVVLAWLGPWMLFLVAVVRVKDTLAFAVPLGALLLVWLLVGGSAGEANEMSEHAPSSRRERGRTPFQIVERNADT